MGLHRAFVAYAMCDGRDGDGRNCPAFVLPPMLAEPTGPSAVLIPNLEVYAQAQALGWQIPRDDDGWLCPAHKPKPSGSQP